MHLYWKKSSPELASQFQSNWIQNILGWTEFKTIQIKGQVLFKRDIITKIGWGH
jgi:hypothetical protein